MVPLLGMQVVHRGYNPLSWSRRESSMVVVPSQVHRGVHQGYSNPRRIHVPNVESFRVAYTRHFRSMNRWLSNVSFLSSTIQNQRFLCARPPQSVDFMAWDLCKRFPFRGDIAARTGFRWSRSEHRPRPSSSHVWGDRITRLQDNLP